MLNYAKWATIKLIGLTCCYAASADPEKKVKMLKIMSEWLVLLALASYMSNGPHVQLMNEFNLCSKIMPGHAPTMARCLPCYKHPKQISETNFCLFHHSHMANWLKFHTHTHTRTHRGGDRVSGLPPWNLPSHHRCHPWILLSLAKRFGCHGHCSPWRPCGWDLADCARDLSFPVFRPADPLDPAHWLAWEPDKQLVRYATFVEALSYSTTLIWSKIQCAPKTG